MSVVCSWPTILIKDTVLCLLLDCQVTTADDMYNVQSNSQASKQSSSTTPTSANSESVFSPPSLNAKHAQGMYSFLPIALISFIW